MPVFLAYFIDRELSKFYNMSANATTFRQAAAQTKQSFDNLHQKNMNGLVFACYACHGMKAEGNMDHWVSSSAGGKLSLKSTWNKLARNSKCVPTTRDVDRKFKFALVNAQSHLKRLEESETTEEVEELRDTVLLLHKAMEINNEHLTAGCDWVTKVGPEELQIHCFYGVPLVNWEVAMKAPGNPDALEHFVRSFIKDYNEKKRESTPGDRDSVPAGRSHDRKMTEDNWRVELQNVGFWPHSHASWYLVATKTRLEKTEDKYTMMSSSGHNQAWYDCIGLGKYQAGVHDLYQVVTIPIYEENDIDLMCDKCWEKKTDNYTPTIVAARATDCPACHKQRRGKDAHALRVHVRREHHGRAEEQAEPPEVPEPREDDQGRERHGARVDQGDCVARHQQDSPGRHKLCRLPRDRWSQDRRSDAELCIPG